MRVSQTIKNIVAGISQQPPILRHAEQLEEQINGYSTEADGLQKRPPTVLMKKLKSFQLVQDKQPKIHLINRDEKEQYFVSFNGERVQVFDLKGNEYTIKNATHPYIQTNKPLENIHTITQADYTFICNTEKVTRMKEDMESNAYADGVLIFIKEGQYGRLYSIKLNNKEIALHSTPTGKDPDDTKWLDTIYITNALSTSLNSHGRKHIKGAHWIYLQDIKEGKVTASDGFNNQALKVIRGEVTKVTDLPSTAPDGYIVKIRGDANKDDDYYLKYDEKANIWKETVKDGVKTTIDASTMPHALVRNSDNTFEIKELEWDKRLSGDEDSNPTPSFIDNKITDIFFFRNRLGFISGENVCLSCSGDYYNFFVDSATGIIDTDPIDLGVSSTRVSKLHSAVPFNQDLVLFSDSAQFILHAEGVLTPKNAYLAQVTAFSNDTSVRPEVSGRNIYFTSKRAEYTSVKEYYAITSDSSIKDASDVTSHVPNYIANTVYDLISNTNENLLLALSTADKTKIYVYKYLYAQEHKLQASWSHWQFKGEILGLGFINSSLYMLMKYDNLVCLERLDITFNTEDFDKEPYRLMMDRKENITLQGTYDETLSTFTWNAKEHFETQGDVDFKYFIVLYDGRVFEGTDNKVTIPFVENLNGQKAYVGIAYDYKIKLSTIYIKHREQEGTQPMDNYRLILQYLKLQYSSTGNMFVLVQSTGKPLRKYHFTGRKVGNEVNRINVHPIITGEWQIPIHGTNTDTSITIENDSPLPSTLIGYTWMGNMTNRFRTI